MPLGHPVYDVLECTLYQVGAQADMTSHCLFCLYVGVLHPGNITFLDFTLPVCSEEVLRTTEVKGRDAGCVTDKF